MMFLTVALSVLTSTSDLKSIDLVAAYCSKRQQENSVERKRSDELMSRYGFGVIETMRLIRACAAYRNNGEDALADALGVPRKPKPVAPVARQYLDVEHRMFGVSWQLVRKDGVCILGSDLNGGKEISFEGKVGSWNLNLTVSDNTWGLADAQVQYEIRYQFGGRPISPATAMFFKYQSQKNGEVVGASVDFDGQASMEAALNSSNYEIWLRDKSLGVFVFNYQPEAKSAFISCVKNESFQ